MTDNNIEKSKQELIAEIDKRIEDKIIEKTNADLLKKLINNAETLTEAVAIAELGTTYKRTGFQFDKRLEKMSNTIKYFKKNEILSFKTDENAITHKLIIGDNYDALLNLLIEYRNKIDVIYIDPPYGKDSMGEFAQTNYENALTRDNLLSMLYPRLILAKQLLSDTGVIYCSIDDLNIAYVKGLFDEIFGERNCVGIAPRKTKGSATTKSDAELQDICDYLIVYFNEKNGAELRKKIIGEKTYPMSDERGNFYTVPLQDNGPHGTREARPNLWYPIYQLENGDLTYTKPESYIKEILPSMHQNKEGRWMWSKKKFDTDWKDLYVKDDKIFIKHYHNSEEDQMKYQREKLWLDKFPNADGTKMLNDIMEQKGLFSNPKPVELIEWCINLAKKDDNIIVLDFFAGSGSTGQAVLELNAEDSCKRQFILVTSNEITNTTPNGIVKDVTSKRLKRIMTGECYDGTNNFKWIEKNKPLGDNLDVYEINTVANFEATKDKTPFDVIDETLYGKEKFSVNDKIKWVCENFDGTQSFVETDREYENRIRGEE
ncbi:MAG TPA: site-specific DNA-methyltransferase [Bacilli bacterium]|nr:site-specific DNA-methyltransferase [Bacilli bacterium]